LVVSMSPILSSVAGFTALFAVLSIVGALLINKFVPAQDRIALRPVTQPTLTVVGMMFSILLGFFIAQGQRDYTTANSNVVNEANTLGEVFRDARGLPETDRVRIRRLCRNYLDAVVTDEWEKFSHGETSDKAPEIMNELWEASMSVEPNNIREQVIYESYMDAVNRLASYRRMRLGTSEPGIEPYFWSIIAVGASAIVWLTFMFAPESKSFHAALLACLVVPLILNIYLLSEYTHPFTPGLVAVKPTMFETVRTRIFINKDDAPRFLKQKSATPAAP